MGKAKELATQSITLSKSVDESFKQSQNSLAIEKFKTISVVSNSSYCQHWNRIVIQKNTQHRRAPFILDKSQGQDHHLFDQVLLASQQASSDQEPERDLNPTC